MNLLTGYTLLNCVDTNVKLLNDVVSFKSRSDICKIVSRYGFWLKNINLIYNFITLLRF